ncbi:MAG: VWA domain-containing protein [Phaeodactylibacter sp.]|nr:VWA domain-containing protein [Phaeodactylibacter sp.]
MEDRLEKWRLILGKKADERQQFQLEGELLQMDAALEALYDSDRSGGLGSSHPNVNRWLGDIRKYFPSSVVQIIQKDAFERLGIERMLLEPELLESLEPNAELAALLLSFKELIPDKTRDTARLVIQKIARQIEERLRQSLIQSVRGALNRGSRNLNPSYREINWPQTIRKNLKHALPQQRTIIPEHLIGFGRKRRSLKHIILLVDQSASMAGSIVYAGIAGATLASLSALKTSFVFFDTQIADLSAQLQDPVNLLFSAQLGGGTDIGKALSYGQTLIERPLDTTLLLITDLFEGGRPAELLRKAQQIEESGANLICLLALNDQGAPSYDHGLARQLSQLDIPAFACTPDLFPELMAAALQRQDIRQWTERFGISIKN